MAEGTVTIEGQLYHFDDSTELQALLTIFTANALNDTPTGVGITFHVNENAEYIIDAATVESIATTPELVDTPSTSPESVKGVISYVPGAEQFNISNIISDTQIYP